MAVHEEMRQCFQALVVSQEGGWVRWVLTVISVTLSLFIT